MKSEESRRGQEIHCHPQGVFIMHNVLTHISINNKGSSEESGIERRVFGTNLRDIVMPSGPFVNFMARKIPHILLRYLVQQFAMMSKLAWFHITLMQCPSCVCSLTGWWRQQTCTLVMRSIDMLCQEGSIDEIMEFDSRIPREYHLSKWLPQTQGVFAETKDGECPVISQFLRDGIIMRREDESGITQGLERRTRRFIEPITGVTLRITGHASELFDGHSDLYRWTPNPSQNDGGGIQREETREDKGVYAEMDEGGEVYV